MSSAAHMMMIVPVLVLAKGTAVAGRAAPTASLAGPPAAVPAALIEQTKEVR